MYVKLFDSELKVMEVLWERGDTTAKEIAAILNDQVGWSKTTTYTVIKKCVAKNAIERKEPNFICSALISKAETQRYETQELVKKLYDGCTDKLIVSLLSKKTMSKSEIMRLKELVNKL